MEVLEVVGTGCESGSTSVGRGERERCQKCQAAMHQDISTRNVHMQPSSPAALIHRHGSVDVEEVDQERRKLVIVNATCRFALGTSMLAICGDKHEFVPAQGQGRIGRMLKNIDIVSTNINVANPRAWYSKCVRQYMHNVRLCTKYYSCFDATMKCIDRDWRKRTFVLRHKIRPGANRILHSRRQSTSSLELNKVQRVIKDSRHRL